MTKGTEFVTVQADRHYSAFIFGVVLFISIDFHLNCMTHAEFSCTVTISSFYDELDALLQLNYEICRTGEIGCTLSRMRALPPKLGRQGVCLRLVMWVFSQK